MPSHIGIMALTATATRALRLQVEQMLGMRSPLAIIHSPDKQNLRLSATELKCLNNYGVSKIFNHILVDLREKLTLLPRILIFCKTKIDCPKLYTFFKAGLGKYFTYPPGASPDLVECRLVDMFFKGTGSFVKQKIIENFTKDSCLRVVFCTDAFGMGVNCPDVRLVIHYGVPSDAETYVQQIGRSGRDGRESYAVILHSKKKMENCNEHMTNYVENKRLCRRDHLFKDFENTTHASINKGCRCCDVCIKECSCGQCIESLSQNYSFIPLLFNQKI